MKDMDSPSYTRDIVGPITQWDERDVIFARNDLFRYFGTQSPQYAEYYAAHPQFLENDAKTAAMPGLGRTGGVDEAMTAAQFQAVRSISADSFVDGTPAAHKTEIPPQRAAVKVKSLARLLGAGLVKIGPLRQEWVYSRVGRTAGNRDGYQPWGAPIDLRHHSNAIALGFPMNMDLLRCAPDYPEMLATTAGYASGAWVAVQLAQYIRMLGYSARAHHLYNYQVLCVPVAVDCGMGELSRAGYLLTKEFGLGLRLAVVTTDMPLAYDKPVDAAVQSFCATCKICAEECPIGAIPTGNKVECNGVQKWKLDAEKCYRYWHAMGTDCGLCMISCPWTKPRTWLHRSMATLATTDGPHQILLAQAHKLVYGRFRGKQRPAFIDPDRSH